MTFVLFLRLHCKPLCQSTHKRQRNSLITLLDQKAGNMTSKLKKAIKELLWYVTEDYNSKNNTNYDANLIKVDINKNMITNDAELVSMIQASKGIVSDHH